MANKQRYNLMLNPQIHDRMKKRAEDMGISVSALVSLVMHNYLEQQEKLEFDSKVVLKNVMY